MKHYITVRQNGRELSGIDLTIIVHSELFYLGASRIRKEFARMQERIDNLKGIKPYLNDGNISIHYSNK